VRRTTRALFRHRFRRRAFTLVEVLVATVLLGIGVAACMACIGTATRASALGEEYTAVGLMAREKLAEIELQGARPGADQGDFGSDRPGYAWKTAAQPSGTPGLEQVTLTILWGSEANPRQAEFRTLVREQRR